MVKIFEGARENKRYVFTSVVLGIAFWLAQFAYQYFFLIPGEIQGSIVRSAALTGATLIGIALIIGPLAKFWPTRNYIQHRRTFGVLGFTFIIVHMLSVMFYFFNFGFAELFQSLNPYANPILFGLAAFLIFIPLYLTSTDWAVEKLGFLKWKSIHRLVYVAYILSVLHFIQINPLLLLNPAGYFLLAVTASVFALEMAAFLKYVREKGGKGKYIGGAIIVIGIILFYLVYAINKSGIVLYGIPIVSAVLIAIYAVYWLKKRKEEQQEEKQKQENKLNVEEEKQQLKAEEQKSEEKIDHKEEDKERKSENKEAQKHDQPKYPQIKVKEVR